MTFVLIVLGAVLCVEIVDPNGIGTVGTCKQVTSVAKLDFFTSFDLKCTWLRREFLSQYVVDRNFINKGVYNVESTWMESYSQGLIRENARNNF